MIRPNDVGRAVPRHVDSDALVSLAPRRVIAKNFMDDLGHVLSAENKDQPGMHTAQLVFEQPNANRALGVNEAPRILGTVTVTIDADLQQI